MHLKEDLIWDVDGKKDEFPKKIREIYFKNYVILRKKYTNWIGKISEPFSNDIDWWVSTPASRNPNFSKIFDTICVLETIKKIKISNIKIITSSIELYDLIKLHFREKRIKVHLNKNRNDNKNLINFFHCIIFQTIIYIIINFFYKKKIPKNNKIVLINSYPTYNINKIERLFQFSKKFIKINKKKIVYIPTILANKNIFKVFGVINFLSKENYVFKENLLYFRDLIYAFRHPTRVRKFKVKFTKYDQFDLSNLIYNELKSLKYFNAKMIGILNYKFVERLKFKKTNISKTFCWLENHEQKGWSLGFRKFLPSVKTFGYQGFTNLPQLMNTIPTKFEEKFRVIPSTIVVSGKAYVKPRSEFYSKLNIKVGPSFIYNSVHRDFKINKKIKFLVILGEILSINLSVLDWLYYSIKKNNDLVFYIKKPKLLNLDEFIDNKYIKKNIFFCEGNLSNFLKQAENVLVSGPTGSTLESLAYNCKLIIPKIDPYDSLNLSSVGAPKKMYKILNDKNKFSSYLNKINLKKKDNKNKLNLRKFRNHYFEKSSIKNENIFI
ncbi:hypothetical protein N9X11_01615 [Candidatus Pelagibacter bacterium]|nr:hypothetical protein [Candidatus Pelagibacter bacterium]|tara:strand:- start:77 stop:1729 length:1653 start_codon:yes stop_codon:yes gene_type:complete